MQRDTVMGRETVTEFFHHPNCISTFPQYSTNESLFLVWAQWVHNGSDWTFLHGIVLGCAFLMKHIVTRETRSTTHSFFLFLTVIFHHHCHYSYFVWDQNLCLCFSSSISDSNNRSELNDEQHHSQIRRILYPRITKPSTECTSVWNLERYGKAFYE